MRQEGFYRFLYPIVTFVLRLIYRPQIEGLSNVPTDGSFIVCANHSSNLDAFLMMCFIGRAHQIHVMAKKELFDAPVIGWIMRKTQMICVDRSKMDINSVRLALNYLKSGAKIGIFPEGTRVSEGESLDAKAGIVRLADKTGVPVVPMFIPTHKPPFRKTPLIFGEPFYINPERIRLAAEDSAALAENVMDKIRALKP